MERKDKLERCKTYVVTDKLPNSVFSKYRNSTFPDACLKIDSDEETEYDVIIL